jgi:hypothetical protein
MDLTFISLLQALNKFFKMTAVAETTAVRTPNMHPHPQPRLNAAALLGPIMLKIGG